MLPVLFHIGNYPIHSFGVFVAAGFLAGMYWIRRESIRRQFPVVRMMDLTFYLMVWGLVGARLLFVAINWDLYADRPLDVFKIWQGGLVWYGGFIVAGIAGLVLLRRYRLPLAATADILCTAVPYGHAYGRLGCLAVGDDHGRLIESALRSGARALLEAGRLYQSDGRLTPEAIRTIRAEGFDLPWWGITLGPESLVQSDLVGMPIHPAQLYMSFYTLAIFIFLAWWRRHQRFDGELAALMLLIYPVCRFVVEYFRGDLGRGFLLPGLSTSQVISIGLFGLGCALYAALPQRHRETSRT